MSNDGPGQTTSIKKPEWLERFSANCEAWLPNKSGNVVVKSVVQTENKTKQILRLPGSKSYSNRALVLAGLSKTPVTLNGLGVCDDSYWVLNALSELGYEIDCLSISESYVDVVIPPLTRASATTPKIYIGKAGTAARFLPALLLNHSLLQKTIVSAHPQLQKRPQRPLLEALEKLGAQIHVEADSGEISYRYSELQGQTTISGATSGQFLSGLLMAASAARHAIGIQRHDDLVQPDYVLMTIALLRQFGADIQHSNLTSFAVKPVDNFGTTIHCIEPDASTACYFMTIAALLNQSVEIANIGSQSLQPDVGFSKVLALLGFHIDVRPTSLVVEASTQNHIVKKQMTIDFSLMSDQAITAGVLAALCQVDVTVTGVRHIRFHESDRISGLVSNLAALGVPAVATDDGFTVFGTRAPAMLVGSWPCYGDHRFAMSGLLLALKHHGVEILDAGCVNKTAPQFFMQLRQWGVVEFK